jgi:hypothetical protein
MRRWLWLTAAIILANASVGALLIWLGESRHGKDWYYFKEGGPGTILSVANLLGCAAVCGWLGRRLSPDPFARYWFGMCILFALAGFDDFFRLHESVSHRMSEWFGYSRRHRVLRHLDDVLLIAYAVAALVLTLMHARRLLALRPMIACFGLAGVFFGGMVSLDLLRWSYAYEDSMKILAGAVILCGLLYPLFLYHRDRHRLLQPESSGVA